MELELIKGGPMMFWIRLVLFGGIFYLGGKSRIWPLLLYSVIFFTLIGLGVL